MKMPYNYNFVFGDKNVQVPAHLNFGQFMLEHIRQWNDEIAIENADTGEKLSYKEIAQYVVNLSASLTSLGVGRGDTVALGSQKHNEFVPTLLAIVLTGATYTP
uniref:AMP-dependent synthetase/ligase domain-containing protein n=1 Tax=Bombyx mori TaxID=7091 RepID=A0A8R2LVA4_BOMMO|nr:acetyl-coenzyme A synthetase 1 [Bombyx mori]